MAHPDLNLDQFRLNTARPPDQPKSPRVLRHSAGGWFLKGPIPGDWLVKASKTSATALRVGLVLWYLAGLTKCHRVKPTWNTWRRFGLSPDAGRRGLVALEQAGLVNVERGPGRCPLVTINHQAPS
jgi:hypothetical protein